MASKLADRKYVAYEGKFIKENCSEHIEVIDNETCKITSNSYKSAKLDTPINMNSELIYCWQIIFDVDQHHTGQFDLCGVVSDKCTNIGATAWGGLIDLYGISCSGKNVWKGTSHDFKKDDAISAEIKKNELVTIELDCKLSTLTFRKNNATIYGPMELPERDAWFPAVGLGFGSWGAQAKFVKMTDLPSANEVGGQGDDNKEDEDSVGAGQPQRDDLNLTLNERLKEIVIDYEYEPLQEQGNKNQKLSRWKSTANEKEYNQYQELQQRLQASEVWYQSTVSFFSSFWVFMFMLILFLRQNRVRRNKEW